MRIESLFRYPVKGLSAESLEAFDVEPGGTVPHDRRFALAQGDAPFDEGSPRFMAKQNFACLMANGVVATVRSAFDERAGTLSLAAPGRAPLTAPVGTAAGRAAIAGFLTGVLGAEARGAPRFVEAPGHAFTDQKRKGVSLINLASLRAVERAIGRTLDPLRFRANIYFSGLEPWAEFGWVGNDLLAGGARLAVFKRTVRCPAVEVDLETGERDVDLPRLLLEHFGHKDLGVHATVLEGGRIAVGEAVEPV